MFENYVRIISKQQNVDEHVVSMVYVCLLVASMS